MSSETFDSLAVTAHDEGAERAVLGIMMQGRDATAETRRLIRVEDFFKPQHQAIFAAAARLDDDQKPVEPTAILSELTRSGEAKNAGELAVYLTEVFSDAPAPASLSYYTGLVRDTSTRRALSALGMKMQQMSALDGVENPGEIVERMRSTLDSLAVERLGADVPLAGDIVTSTLEEIDALSKGGMVMGVPTGFTELDTALNGLRPAQMVVVAARPGMGKALALDTPIPTPSGWTTMGELIVGDFVLGRDGKPTRVTATTEYQYDRQCFEVEFSDGTVIVADADHQWVTETRAERRKGQPTSYVGKPSITTAQIAETLRVGEGRANHSVPVAQPLQLPDQELPIAPYVLGAWLGDGGTGKASFYSADAEMITHFEDRGYFLTKTGSADPYEYRISIKPPTVKMDRTRACISCGTDFLPKTAGQTSCSLSCGADARRGLARGERVRDQAVHQCDSCGSDFTGFENGRCTSCRNDSFIGQLRDLGVLTEKHIPTAYLRGSEAQRRELLAGLIDTDGSTFTNGLVQYYSTNPRLAREVRELALSLGYRATIATKGVKGRSEATSTAHTVQFTTSDKVAKLQRKRRNEVRVLNSSRTGSRFIVDVRPIPSVPVRCIQVDNDEHLYLAGEAMVPTHNTAFALDIVRHAAFKVGKSVMMFSLEMSANELMMRALAAEAYVDLQSLKTGQLDDHKWQQLAQATQRIHGSKLGIDDTATVTITDIRAKARAFQRVHGLDMIVIDYIQLMNSDRRSDSRQQEVSEISRGIKLLAKEFGVPVIALSQLNRGSEQRQDKKPQVSDLRESGAIEQDSDVVILLHREEVYEKETPRAGEADVIIAKQRSGPTGTVILSWLGKYSRFDNRSIAGF